MSEQKGVINLPESPYYKGPPRETPQIKDGCSNFDSPSEISPMPYSELLWEYWEHRRKENIRLHPKKIPICLQVMSRERNISCFIPDDISSMSETEAEKLDPSFH